MSDTTLDETGVMTKKAAGEYVISLRRLAGLNQDVLAGRVGLSDRQLSRIENGQSTPSLLVLRRLMRELNGSIDRFAELLASKQATIADAMRDAASGRDIKDLARQIQSEAELEELIREYRNRPPDA